MIRPEAVALLYRWREVIFAALALLASVWVGTRGGPILGVLGLGGAALAVGWAVSGWRRLRFAQDIAAPGLVEVVEGEVRFFGPTLGGAISLADLTELRLITLRGRRIWRLKQRDGQALLIPVDAAGAEALYDAFTTLPGLDMTALLAALTPATTGPGLVSGQTPDMVVIWHRKGTGLVA